MFLAAALLFLTPLFFHHRSDRGPPEAGSTGPHSPSERVLVPLFHRLVGGDFDLLATGLIGGTLAYLIGRAKQ